MVKEGRQGKGEAVTEVKGKRVIMNRNVRLL